MIAYKPSEKTQKIELELEKIIANALLGKNTLIIGKRGVGKSTLIDQAISILNGSIHRIDISQEYSHMNLKT